MWQQWVNGVLGVWILASPFMSFTEAAMRTNLVVTGIVVAVLAFWGAAEEQKHVHQR